MRYACAYEESRKLPASYRQVTDLWRVISAKVLPFGRNTIKNKYGIPTP